MTDTAQAPQPNWYRIPANILEVGCCIFGPETKITNIRVIRNGLREVLYVFTLTGGNHHNATLYAPPHLALYATTPTPAPSPSSP